MILEAVIDYGADRLEELRAEALGISQRIFHKEMQEQQTYNVSRVNRMLRDTLVEIGDMGERLSYIRDTLLVLQRAVPFVAEHGDGWLEDPLKARLKMAGSDVQSLNEYEIHLTDKIQFLLSAALGFISTEQNDLFKIMTIWSVVGIPPVLVAGIYGMNFTSCRSSAGRTAMGRGWKVSPLSCAMLCHERHGALKYPRSVSRI